MSNGFRVVENAVYKTVGDVNLALDYAVDDNAPPAGSGGVRPIIVMIHGGAWLGGGRAGPGTRIVMQRFAQKGLLVSSISYRLSSAAIFPAQLQDVWDSVKWLRENAPNLGADGGAVGAMGHSAWGAVQHPGTQSRRSPDLQVCRAQCLSRFWKNSDLHAQANGR